MFLFHILLYMCDPDHFKIHLVNMDAISVSYTKGTSATSLHLLYKFTFQTLNV